jgi:hypothetical protein
MDPRKLIAALLAALVAGGLVWWSTETKKTEESKDGPRPPQQVLALKTPDLRKLQWVRRDAETTVLESADGRSWQVTAPLQAPADAEAVNALLASLATVNADEVVAEKTADFSSYGLAQPSLTATFTLQGGRSHVLQFGDESPLGSGVYARLDNGPRLLLLSLTTRTAIDKFAADLRDRRLVTLAAGKLVRVVLRAPKGEVEFAKAGSGDWQISRPSPMRADGWAVEEAIRKLREARFDATLTSDNLKEVAAAFAAAQPVVTATFSDGAQSQTLEVRKNAASGKFYARSPSVEGPQLLAGEPLDGFDKTAADYRSRKLFDFGFSDPVRIYFQGAAKEITLSKSADKWVSGGKAMDSVGVQSFVDRLRDLSATGFPEAPFPAPTMQIHVTSNEGKRLEKVALSMAGDKWYARREGEPAVYELAAEAVSQLVKTVGDIREAPAPSQQKK